MFGHAVSVGVLNFLFLLNLAFLLSFQDISYSKKIFVKKVILEPKKIFSTKKFDFSTKKLDFSAQKTLF